MDTASHFVVGIGLAGLSQLDPTVAGDPSLQLAVILATIIGSQAPDFDTVTRIHNNSTYVRQHRGMSHSFPFVIIWTILISFVLKWIFTIQDGFVNLLVWTLVAVVLHVAMDLFNTYGTQALRPFSRTWVSWNIIHIFDPFIFVTHAIAGGLWILGWVKPTILFPILYVIIACYYMVRIMYHRHLYNHLVKTIPIDPNDQLTIIPTVKYRLWHLMVKKNNGSYVLGTCKKGNIKWLETVSSDHSNLIESSRKHPCVSALLNFSQHTVAHVTEHSWGTEVRWCDVRYRYRKQYPFVAIVFYDHNEKPLASYVGWLSDQKLYKRLYAEAKLAPL